MQSNIPDSSEAYAALHLSDSKSLVKEKNRLLTALDQLQVFSQKQFGKPLFSAFKQLSESLQSLISQPNQSLDKVLKDTASFLDIVDKLDGDFLENFNEDIKEVRRKNRKITFSQFIELKSSLIGNAAFKCISDVKGSVAVSPYYLHSNEHLAHSSGSTSSESQTILKQDKTISFLKGNIKSVSKTMASFFTESSPIRSVSDLEMEELEGCIRGMLQNGLQSLDDIAAIMKLINELGFGASIHMLNDISKAIQDFVDTIAVQMADPVEILSLLVALQQLVEGDVVQQLNLDSVNNQVTQMIQTLSSKHQESISTMASQVGAMGFSIQPIEVAKDQDSVTPLNQDHHDLLRSNVISAQKITENKQNSKRDYNKEDTSVKKVNRVKKLDEGSHYQEFKKSYVGLLERANKLREESQPILVSGMLSIMNRQFSSRFNTLLNGVKD